MSEIGKVSESYADYIEGDPISLRTACEEKTNSVALDTLAASAVALLLGGCVALTVIATVGATSCGLGLLVVPVMFGTSVGIASLFFLHVKAIETLREEEERKQAMREEIEMMPFPS